MTNWLQALRATCEKATKGPWRFAWAEGYNEDEPFPLCKTTWGNASWPNGYPVIEGKHNDEPNVRYCATFNPQMVAAMLDVVEAAVKAADEIDLFYTKMEQESRKQTIWEDEHDLWFARANIQLKLAALKKLVGGEDE